MELRQLNHFVALAEEMHFGRASARLFITQPALSASLRRLEQAFGVRLFERDSKSVRLTAAGQIMLISARETLDRAARTMSLSHMLASGHAGRIEIGISGTLLSIQLDQALSNCRTDYPDIQVQYREISSYKQLELLREGRLDAGLVVFPLPPADLSHIALMEDQFAVCLSMQHRLAKQTTLNLSELSEELFVLQSRSILNRPGFRGGLLV